MRLLLEEIQISIDEVQAQASAYTSYQKKFKVLYSLAHFVNSKMILAKGHVI